MFDFEEMKVIHDALLTLLLLDEEIDGKNAYLIEKVLYKSTCYVSEMRDEQ